MANHEKCDRKWMYNIIRYNSLIVCDYIMVDFFFFLKIENELLFISWIVIKIYNRSTTSKQWLWILNELVCVATIIITKKIKSLYYYSSGNINTQTHIIFPLLHNNDHYWMFGYIGSHIYYMKWWWWWWLWMQSNHLIQCCIYWMNERW